MRFGPETLTLKNGEVLTLRSPEEGNAEGMLDFLRTTAGETTFLLRTPEEVTLTPQEERAYLRGVLEDPRAMMVCAFAGEAPVGCASFRPVGERLRVRHRAECGIAILRACWGQGLGRALMRALLRGARKAGFEQMELTVYADNARAIRLYESLGFQVWGRRLNACRLAEGTYRDDLLMGRFLGDGDA